MLIPFICLQLRASADTVASSRSYIPSARRDKVQHICCNLILATTVGSHISRTADPSYDPVISPSTGLMRKVDYLQHPCAWPIIS